MSLRTFEPKSRPARDGLAHACEKKETRAAILRKLERQGAERLKIHRKSKVFTSYKVVFVADVGSVLLGLSLHGLALLAALEKAHFLGSQSKFQELRSASGFKRALDLRSSAISGIEKSLLSNVESFCACGGPNAGIFAPRVQRSFERSAARKSVISMFAMSSRPGPISVPYRLVAWSAVTAARQQ